ncbi:MAG: tetratricopeptide repeat protein [Planctomycetes bacterium]|nr:tetratricopeptide repeat protein [Planctomycetota bacterium]
MRPTGARPERGRDREREHCLSDTTADESRTERVWTAALVAALVALAIYVPRVWGHGFVNYDDPYVLAPENPAIGKGLLAGLPDLLQFWKTPQFMNAWLPLYYWSLGIDHALFGGAPLGWHLHSVMIHAGCAAMVAVLARRLGLGWAGAAVAGVVFAVHPAAVENVAWVAGRKDVLSFLWMSFAAYAYLEAIRRAKPGLHVVGAFCLFVSLVTKGTTLVLPLLLLVHATILRDAATPRRERLRAVLPYGVVAFVMTAFHFWVAQREGTAGGVVASFGAIAIADFDVVGRYAGLLLAPFAPIFRQSVEHGIDPDAPNFGRVAVGAVVIAAWGGALWRTRVRHPRVAALLLCVPLALAPFNNLLPRTSVLFAERYAYIAIVPVAFAIGALVHAGGNRQIIAAVATTAFAAFAWLRIPVWHDSVTLWADAADAAPASAIVRMQLADAYATTARERPAESDEWNAKAESAWRESVVLAASATSAFTAAELARMRAETGLGTLLLTTGPGGTNTEERVRESVALFESAERRLAGIDAPGAQNSALATILSNRAAARETLGDVEKALADWTAAVRADETSPTAWSGLARLSFAMGHAKEGSEALARSAALAPRDTAAARDRSKLRLAVGDVSGAKMELETALGVRPDDYDLVMDLARLDASLQRPLDAEKRFRRALELRADDAAAKQGVAAALLDHAQAQCARDDVESARKAALAAAEIAPDSSAPQQILGIVARRAGDLEEATLRFRRARDLYPEGVRIREALAAVLLERSALAFDAKSDTIGTLLAEEAVAADPPTIATRSARIETGTSGWPKPPLAPDERATVTRQAALRGLALLAAGRAADALPELVVAERGSRDAEPALRRNVLRLLVRARFLAGRIDDAVAAAEELPALCTPELPWQGWADLASALIERGIARRGSKDAGGSAADFDRARSTLDAAASHGMPIARWHLRRGEILFSEERFVDATREFDLASDSDPKDPEPYLDRASVWRAHYLMEEDKSFLDGAEKDLRRALLLAPSDPRAMAALGEVLVFTAKPSEAYPWLQRALLADPSQAGSRRLLAELAVRAGRSHLEKKELKEAKETADRAVGLDALTPEPLIFLGDVLRAQGEWDRALASYEAAAARWPESVEPRAALAKYYFDAGHVYLLDDKRRAAARAFRRCKTYDQSKFDVSAADDRLHQIAVGAFQDGIRLQRAAKSKSDAGTAAEAAKLIEESASSFETSVIAEPTPEGRFNLGLVLTEAGRLDDALAAYTAASEESPGDAAIRINRAAVLLRLGRWDESERDYRWIVEHRPAGDADRAAATRQLAWIDAQRKELDGGPKK